MVGVLQIGRGHPLQQFVFDFIGRLSRGQSGAVRQPEQMGVHRDGGLAKSNVQDHVGRLAAHAGQGLQGLAGAGHGAAMLREQNAAGLHQVPGLAAKKSDGPEIALQTVLTQGKNHLWRVGNRKQLARCPVHAHVGGLSREHNSA